MDRIEKAVIPRSKWHQKAPFKQSPCLCVPGRSQHRRPCLAHSKWSTNVYFILFYFLAHKCLFMLNWMAAFLGHPISQDCHDCSVLVKALVAEDDRNLLRLRQAQLWCALRPLCLSLYSAVCCVGPKFSHSGGHLATSCSGFMCLLAYQPEWEKNSGWLQQYPGGWGRVDTDWPGLGPRPHGMWSFHGPSHRTNPWIVRWSLTHWLRIREGYCQKENWVAISSSTRRYYLK